MTKASLPSVSASESDALWSLSATRIAALVSGGEISALEVARAAMDRLSAVNPALNAVVDFRPETAIAAAQAVDDGLAAGRDMGPLAGVPVTTKVNVDQAGFPTTNGLNAQKDLVAKSNNPVVQNLIDAGAVPLGRTNTPAFSYRWFTSNLLHGRTVNPRGKGLTPGGSSGGAAASVAAGIGAIAHGTDIAGSVRYPAYACGVHGLRPTIGRVAAWNGSGKDRPIGPQMMAVSGPLARHVGDLRLALQAMMRPDVRDPLHVAMPFNGPDVQKRAAMCIRPDGLDTAPEIEVALRAAAARLVEAGWIVEELDDLPPINEAVKVQIILWMGDNYDGQVAAAQAEGDPGAIAALAGQREFVEALGAQDLPEAFITRLGIVRAWMQFIARYPVVLLPPCGELPFEDDLDLKSPEDYARVWRAQAPMLGLPVTGLPSLALNTGFTPNGTPVGVQIVSGKFREDLCLDAAEAIEARMPPCPIAMLP